MFSLEISLKAEQITKALENVQGMDMALLHKDLGDTMVKIIENRFRESKDPRGEMWKPIKKHKYNGQMRFPSDRPLMVHDLFQSFSYDASSKEAVVGTPKQYAKYHTDFPANNGMPRSRVPLREFMGIESDEDAELLLDRIDEHLERALHV